MNDRHDTDDRTEIDERAQRRRRRIAALTVALPILAGLVIAALVHFLGGEEENVTKPEGEQRAPHRLVEAAAPAETGSPAPRVRLTEATTGRRFDSASLGDTPYAVVFISTRCETIGDFLARATRDLSGAGAILAITADPEVDSPKAVKAWLARHHLGPNGPLHYLVGDESEVSGYWNAWGFNGPSSACTDSVPAHLVGSSKGAYVNTGVLDIDPTGSAEILTVPLRA
ncbi:MAG TPA: SCO family protein, partial [Solirubrobacterales bacterium]|nr:SCO family protein [Solirubrobacterales bacterium]